MAPPTWKPSYLVCLHLVLSILCNTIHVKTISLTTFGLCSIVTKVGPCIHLPGFKRHSPLPFCLWRTCGLLFSPCELSSAVGFNKPKQRSSPSTKILQIWPSLPQVFICRKPQGPRSFSSTCCSLIFVHVMKIHFTEHLPEESVACVDQV